MLVLTRKPRETIHLGDNIIITILKVKGSAVRVGIEAPDSVRVVRGELADRHASDTGTIGSPATSREYGQSSDGTPEKLCDVSFQPQPRMSTQHVNQILALRQRVQQVVQRQPRAVLAAS